MPSIGTQRFVVAAVAAFQVLAVAALAAPGPFTVKIANQQPDSISVAPGQQVIWTVNILNEGDAMPGAKLAWRLAAWDGKTLKDVTALDISKGDNKVVFHAVPPQLGWFELTVDVVGDDGNTLASSTHAFAVAEPYRAKPGSFRYGLVSHVFRHSGERYKREMDTLGQLGIDWARADIIWGQVEPEDNQWDFKRVDQVLADLNSMGIEQEAVLAYTTKWATTADPNAADWKDWARAMPRMEPWLEYVETVLKRYPQIKIWEVWNEPDIGAFWRGTTDEYITLFNTTTKLIRQVRPDVTISNGGFAMVSRVPNPDFMKEFPGRADNTNWDMWAYHDYHTFEALHTRFATTHAMMEQTGKNLDIWVNEGGFNELTNGGVNEQAITLVKKLSTAPYLGIKGYGWYVMVDPGNDPNDRENYFGLLRFNLQPRPQFATYQRLIRELAPRTYVKPSETSEMPSQLWANLYQADDANGEHVLVLWRQIAGMTTPMRLSWDGDQNKVTAVIDVMGNPVDFGHAADGGAMINVGFVPVYVHFTGPANHPAIAPVLEAPATITLTPSDESKLKVTLHNPSAHAVTYDLGLTADDELIAASVTPTHVEIEPNKSASITLNLQPKQELSHLTGELQLTLAEPGSEMPVVAAMPYEMAQVIPRRGSSLTIDLLTRENMVNMYSAEPLRTMHWKGPEDLSATSRFSYDEQNLYVKIVATDDTHFPIAGEKLWEGDSIQFCVWVGDDARKFLELNVSCGPDNKPEAWVGRRADYSLFKSGQLADADEYITVERSGDQTVYQLALPWKVFGVDSAPASLRLNYIVNDNDSLGRKGWVQITEGIASGKNPNLFRIFVLR